MGSYEIQDDERKNEMKGLKLEMIEGFDEDLFALEVENFLKTHDVFEVKVQRNLYYAGVGSSDGYKGKGWFFSKKCREQRKIAKGKIKLQKSFLAFIFFKGRR